MNISSREKKFIVFGAAVVAAAVIFYLIALLLPDRESLASQVQSRKEMLVRYREMLSQEEVYQKRVEEYQLHLEKSMTRLLPGDNPNVAEADLQKLLKSFADRSGVEITRTNTLPDKKMEDELVQVSVSVEVNGNLEQLVQFLTEIQNYEKFLKVEQFQITSFPNRQRQQIRPSLTVAGYINSREPEPKEAPPANASENVGQPGE
jgi:general secretion pathway protein M